MNQFNATKSQAVAYLPPEGVTPALARLIWRGDYDVKVFSTALITLAAKGWITIEADPNRKGKYDAEPTLAPTPDVEQTKPLLAREKRLFERLFRGRDVLVLDNSAFLDLKDAQSQHYEALLEEDDVFFRSSFAGHWLVDRVAGWLWPVKTRRSRQVRKQSDAYRRYLSVAMQHRLDPVFQPGGALSEVCQMMPYVLALDVPNSWADEFAANIADLLDDNATTTSLYDLGDKSRRQTGRSTKFRNPAERRRAREGGNDRW